MKLSNRNHAQFYFPDRPFLHSWLRTAGKQLRLAVFLLAAPSLAFAQESDFGDQIIEEPSDEESLITHIVMDTQAGQNRKLSVLGDAKLIAFASDGARITQPAGSHVLPTGLQVEVAALSHFSFMVDCEVVKKPRVNTGSPNGLLIRLVYQDPKVVSPAVGLLAARRTPMSFASTPSYEGSSKQKYDFVPFDLSRCKLAITRVAETLEVSVGDTEMTLRPFASVPCPKGAIQGVEVVCLPNRSKKDAGEFVLREITFVGDPFINQPKPVDYWAYTWPIKWIVGLGFIAGLAAYAAKHDLYRRRIF
ncbi:MAG: hypothetical protein ACE361_16405 [Aureliella sp.]